MKKLTLIAASAVLATSAMATETKMKLTGRFDYQSAEEKATVGTTTTKTTSGQFKPVYLRWKNTAKFNETTTAELTLNLAKASGANTDGDNFTAFVDTAYLTKSFGNGLSAMIGKQAILFGGWENDYSSADVYTTSTFNADLEGNQIGVTGAYEIAGQKLYLQYLENAGDTAQSLKDKKVVGVAWYGSFMDGNLSPIVSYHKLGSQRVGKYDKVLAAGLQYKVMGITAEFDYLTRTNENGGSTTSSAVADEKTNSMVAHVRYNHDMFVPFAKYMITTNENDSTNAGNSISKMKKTGFEVGLEIVPTKGEDFRYHAVYASSENKDDAGTANRTHRTTKDNTIFAGVKFGLNL